MALPYTISLQCKSETDEESVGFLSGRSPARQEELMRAIVYHKYGSPKVLKLAEIATPVVGDDQVLVKVHAISVNPYDWHMMRGIPYLLRLQTGLFKPKNSGFGNDLAGRVEVVGKNVTEFQRGDEVFGGGRGSLADYVCASREGLVQKPAHLTFEQAAAIPMAGITALQGLRDKGQIQAGQRVLIHGASGGVGTFAVQIAKSYGAEVTGVCSTRNVEMVRSIGADHVIDYTKVDFTQSGQRYDLILDSAGNHSLSEFRRALNPKGILVLVGGGKGDRFGIGILIEMLKVLVLSRLFSQKLVPMLAKRSRADLVVLKELFEYGKISPVIDRNYSLSQAADAIRYLETNHARGKVVITL
jgi:NADPH:quinone reductase-like Zn-dependent oxidoreductase